jgi:hypothetical protein
MLMQQCKLPHVWCNK